MKTANVEQFQIFKINIQCIDDQLPGIRLNPKPFGFQTKLKPNQNKAKQNEILFERRFVLSANADYCEECMGTEYYKSV